MLQMRRAGRITVSFIFSSLNSNRKLMSFSKVEIAQMSCFPFCTIKRRGNTHFDRQGQDVKAPSRNGKVDLGILLTLHERSVWVNEIVGRLLREEGGIMRDGTLHHAQDLCIR